MDQKSFLALTAMVNAFPQGQSTDPEVLLRTYRAVLRDISPAAITETAGRFASGRVADQSKTFAPSVAEFATEARRVEADMRERGAPSGRKLYRYRKPNSRLLERNVTKEYAFRLIDQGVHPRGSIWCPGPLDQRPDIGDLFAPDLDWKPAVPLSQTDEFKPYQPDDAAARVRMGFKLSLLSAALGISGGADRLAQANREGMDSLLALAQQWGVTIPESLWAQRAA